MGPQRPPTSLRAAIAGDPMTPLTRWRTAAVVAAVGWAATALGWMGSTPPSASPVQAEARGERRPDLPPLRGLDAPRRPPLRRSVATEPAAGDAPDLAMLRDEVRQEVLDEIEQERAERRQQRSEHHLDRLLDEVAAFAEELQLGEDAQADLESSMIRMHERLEALRPAGPPEPGGPPPERMEELEQVFDAFRAEVDEVLDDADLADAFTERMTPRPLRERDRLRD